MYYINNTKRRRRVKRKTGSETRVEGKRGGGPDRGQGGREKLRVDTSWRFLLESPPQTGAFIQRHQPKARDGPFPSCASGWCRNPRISLCHEWPPRMGKDPR